MRVKRTILVAITMFGVLASTVYLLRAKSSDAVSYPLDYRKWVHVKTVLESRGFHHIYANEKAMKGYDTGHFQDGSVIVFELLEALDKEGSQGVKIEGSRKLVDVMVKDSKKYATTGGWGYEEFRGDSQTDRTLTEQSRTQCHNCHAKQKDRDFVFSVFRK